MDPYMKISRGIKDDKLLFSITLSRENFNFLCAGCPEAGCLIGRSQGHYHIMLFPGDSMPDAFRYADQSYYATIGVPVDILPPNVTNAEFDRLSQKVCDNLEKAINESKPIPIEDMGMDIGYVVLRVDKPS